jgi:1-phosphatidylinositol-4-phosphate 5-kinase
VAGNPHLRHSHQCELGTQRHANDDIAAGVISYATLLESTVRLPTITALATSAPLPQEGDNNAILRKSTDLNAGGIYMVHSFDMATATAAAGGDADAGRRVSYGGGGLANGLGAGKRYGVEEVATPAVDALPGGWPRTPSGMPTGDVKEGIGGKDGSVLTVPNGLTSQERAASARSTALSSRSRRSSQLDDGKKSGESVKEAMPRLGAAEEGYFHQAVANGKPAAPVKTSTAWSALASPNADLAVNSTPQRSNPSISPMAPNTILPPVKESSPAQPLSNTGPDGRLRAPEKKVHRASSPPAFHPPASQMSNTQGSSTPGRPDGLRQRHTLEVPKLATSRSSRDSQEHPIGSTEGVVSSTGRFSPNTPTKRRGSLQLARRVTRSINSDMHLDDVPQDEDVTRWTEHIKAKRASKKARVDTDDDRVVVGTKVDEHHVNYVTAYNMLTGIRFTVSRTNAKLDRQLTDADFDAKHKFSFDITGNELTPSAKYDFKFKDYAPWVFRDLRAKFRLDPAEYLMSLTSKYILSELGSPGKSGSFFYFSRDYKYIIKTIHHGEHKFLRKILKEYYNHVCENPNTLLSQFYGLHRVKIPYGRKIHFVVMNNLFPPHRDIHRTFDLKGSTIGRDFKEEELEKNPRATLKDLNWLRRNLHLEFGPTKKEAFVAQMQRDVALLQKLKIMDYSMLVGIHDLERGNEEQLRDKTLKVFQPGGDNTEDQNHPTMGALARTPSKLETVKRAKELREMVKKEKPVPMEQMLDKMPEDGHRKDFYFYADDGGFQATHENDLPGEEIYYLGIIDCLTRVSFGSLKKSIIITN